MLIRVAGELLSDAAEQLMLRLTDELNQTPPQVVIDVTAVTVIDAPGANALVLAAAMAGAIDVPLYLRGVHVGGPVETVLTNLGLLDRFQLRDT